MTQEDLARRMFVTRQTISNWESGKSNPDLSSLERLSEVFDIDVIELIYGPNHHIYKRYQKRYILTAAICLTVIIAVIVLEKTVYCDMLDKFEQYFKDGFMISLYVVSVRPAAFFAFGMFLAAVCSFWMDLRLKTIPLRIVLVISVIFLTTSLVIIMERIFLLVAPEYLNNMLFLKIYTSDIVKALFIIVVPLLSGVGLFLGTNRK